MRFSPDALNMVIASRKTAKATKSRLSISDCSFFMVFNPTWLTGSTDRYAILVPSGPASGLSVDSLWRRSQLQVNT